MSHRVLVVDDDGAIRQLLVIAFRRSGIEVDTAVDGCDAIRKLAQSDYAVVILDVMMPCLDGRNVLGQIARRSLPHPAVIATSAIGDPETIHGADLVMEKPFDLLALIEAVKGFLPIESRKSA